MTYRAAKRAIDIVLAVVLLPVVLTVCAVAGLAVFVEDQGPPLHRARRVGLRGRDFTLLKLRTMTPAGARGPAVTVADDARRTRTGRFLRRLHLDEVPQVFNVLLGEMSFVGPRPEDPRFVSHYTAAERGALEMRPGITGLSQLKFRDEGRLLSREDPEGSYVGTILHEKVATDRAYVANASLLIDLRIAWHTFLLVALGRRADDFVDGVKRRGSA